MSALASLLHYFYQLLQLRSYGKTLLDRHVWLVLLHLPRVLDDDCYVNSSYALRNLSIVLMCSYNSVLLRGLVVVLSMMAADVSKRESFEVVHGHEHWLLKKYWNLGHVIETMSMIFETNVDVLYLSLLSTEFKGRKWPYTIAMLLSQIHSYRVGGLMRNYDFVRFAAIMYLLKYEFRFNKYLLWTCLIILGML